jgi:prepilin-type processing-associated H-X9-DG protein
VPRLVDLTNSGRNDVPHVAGLATGSYAFNAGSLDPTNLTGDNTKIFNTGLAHYGTPNGFKDIQDGTSQTFAVGETAYNDGIYPPSVGPNNANNGYFNVWTVNLRVSSTFRTTFNPPNTKPLAGIRAGVTNGAFGSQHTSGVNFSYCDGSVHFIKNTISLPVYIALSTIKNGEVISSDSY